MDQYTTAEMLDVPDVKHDPDKNTLPKHSIHSVIVELENFHYLEISTLVKLDLKDARVIFRKLILENPGLHEDDAAARIAEKLRYILDIDKNDSEIVKGVLSPAEGSLYAEICEGLPYNYPAIE